MRWLADVVKETVDKAKIDRRRRIAASIADVTAEQVDNLSKINEDFWWVPDAVSLSLARGGHTNASPIVEQIARSEASTIDRWADPGQSLRGHAPRPSSNALGPFSMSWSLDRDPDPRTDIDSTLRQGRNPGLADRATATVDGDYFAEQLGVDIEGYRQLRANKAATARYQGLADRAQRSKQVQTAAEAEFFQMIGPQRNARIEDINNNYTTEDGQVNIRAWAMNNGYMDDEDAYRRRFLDLGGLRYNEDPEVQARVADYEEEQREGWRRAHQDFYELQDSELFHPEDLSPQQSTDFYREAAHENPELADVLETQGIQTAGIDAGQYDLWDRTHEALRYTSQTVMIAGQTLIQIPNAGLRETYQAIATGDLSRLPGVDYLLSSHEAISEGDPTLSDIVAAGTGMGDNVSSQTDLGVTIEAFSGDYDPYRIDDVTAEIGEATDPTAGHLVEGGLTWRETWGEGFFPSDVAGMPGHELRLEAERASLSVDGHVATPGRMLAHGVTKTGLINPDDHWYNTISGSVDFANNVVGPGALVFDAGTIGLARMIRPAARALNTGPEALRWTQSRNFSHMTELMAQHNDPYEIWLRSGRKLTPRQSREIASVRDPEMIGDIIRREIGNAYDHQWRYQPMKLSELGIGSHPTDIFGPVRMNRYFGGRQARLSTYMPRGMLDLYDDTSYIVGVERMFKNAHLDTNEMSRVMRRAFTAETPDDKQHAVFAGLATVVRDKMATRMSRRGFWVPLGKLGDEQARTVADGIIRAYGDDLAANRKYWVDAMGDNVPVFATQVDGQVIKAQPHLISEMVGRYMPMPDADDIKGATSLPEFRALAKKGLTQSRYAKYITPETGLPRFDRMIEDSWPVLAFKTQMQFWKFSMLARMAWPIRVVGEEQLRIAGAGYDSILSHPMSYVAGQIAWGKTPQVPFRPALRGVSQGYEKSDELFGVVRNEAGEMVGDSVWNRGAAVQQDYQDALASNLERSVIGELKGQGGLTSEIVNLHSDGFERWARAYSSEVATMHTDPITQMLLSEDNSLRQVQNWFWDGQGKAYRERVGSRGRELQYQGPGGKVITGSVLDDRRAADGYIHSVMQRIESKTAGRDDLKEVIRTGKIGDVPVSVSRRSGVNTQFSDDLADLVSGGTGTFPSSDYAGLPAHVQGPAYVGHPAQGGAPEMLNDAADQWFYLAMSAPTDYLSRSPAVRQMYLHNLEQLAPYMTDDALDAMIKNLESIGKDIRGTRFPDWKIGDLDLFGNYAGQRVVDWAAGKSSVSRLANRLKKYRQGEVIEVSDIRRPPLQGAPDEVQWVPIEQFDEIIDDLDLAEGTITSRIERFEDEGMPALSFDVDGELDGAHRVAAARQAGWEEVPVLNATDIGMKPNLTKPATYPAKRVQPTKRITGAPKGEPEAVTRLIEDFPEAEAVAKARAIKGTRDLLYDLSNKTQIFDSMALVAPFGEAWAEAIKIWTNLFTRRPSRWQRLEQGVRIARGDEEPEADNGFFFRNEFDEEVFTYPLSSEALSRLPLGLPFPLQGRSQGLTLVSEVMPGLGPHLQLGVSVARDKDVFGSEGSEWDWLFDNFLLPFGEVDTSWDELLKAQLPSWGKRFWDAWDPDSHARVRAYGQAATYLLSTGDYEIGDPDHAADEMNRLMSDAESSSKTLLGAQVLASFILPSSPRAVPMVQSEDGVPVPAANIMEMYRSWLEDPSISTEEATAMFLGPNGPGTLLIGAIHPRTQTSHYGGASTQRGYAWLRDLPDETRDRYPLAIGLVAPGHGDDLDMGAYTSSFEEEWGDRDLREGEDLLYQWFDRTAQAIFREERNKFPATLDDDQQRHLDEIRVWLKKAYPGFLDDGLTNYQSKPNLAIRQELQDMYAANAWADDPDVEDWDMHMWYMENRQIIIDSYKADGYGGNPQGETGPDSREIIKTGFSDVRSQRRNLMDLYVLGETMALSSESFAYTWDRVWNGEFPSEIVDRYYEELGN